MLDADRAREALRAIDPGCDRETWVRVGMAAQAAGLEFADFNEWSAGASNYGGERDTLAAWRSFKPAGGIGAGTLYALARAAGWREPVNGRHAPQTRPQERAKPAPRAERPAFDFAAVWRDSEPAPPDHPYIVRKLGLADGLRVYRGRLKVSGQALEGALLVPAFSGDGALQSWQAIPAEPGARKLNAPGATMAGARFLVGGEPRDGEPLYLVEGIGAAWAAHQASGRPAACCFGSGNMERIGRELRGRHPGARLVVVADRGKEGDAERIARAVGGSWVELPADWPTNSDVNDLHQRDGLAAVSELLAQPRTPKPSHDEPRELDLAALATREPTPPAFIVKEWLPAGEVTLLAAHGGTGKSATALHLGVCLALGRDFHGLPVQRRRVDIVSFEDPEPVIHWRLARICHALGVELAALAGWLRIFDGTRCVSSWFARGEFGAYGPTAAFHGMAERIGGPGRVAIVDGSSDAFAGSEIDRAQVKAFLRMLRGLIADDGALLLLSHVDKPGAKAPGDSLGFSGSTGWHNGVRCRWFMYREAFEDGTEGDNVVLEVRKSNYGVSGQRMVLAFDPAAHIFRRVDQALLPSGRPFQRSDEADAIVACIRAAWAAGDPVPAAMGGQRTAHSVLEARDDFPASLKGRAGKARFRKALEQLRAAGRVRVEAVRKANRHVIEVLHAPE